MLASTKPVLHYATRIVSLERAIFIADEKAGLAEADHSQ
jgi:hypothetical protein